MSPTHPAIVRASSARCAYISARSRLSRSQRCQPGDDVHARERVVARGRGRVRRQRRPELGSRLRLSVVPRPAPCAPGRCRTRAAPGPPAHASEGLKPGSTAPRPLTMLPPRAQVVPDRSGPSRDRASTASRSGSSWEGEPPPARRGSRRSWRRLERGRRDRQPRAIAQPASTTTERPPLPTRSPAGSAPRLRAGSRSSPLARPHARRWCAPSDRRSASWSSAR